MQQPLPLSGTASRRWSSSLSDLFWRDVPARTSYVLAALLAGCFVAYLFPLSFLAGHSTVFDYGDIAQHVSGWWYYARDSWHVPLLHTSRLNHPEGISVALTDSIPLAALPFKLLLTLFPHLFPEHFHYFGLWMGLVFVGQALAATLLMRTLGAKSLFALLISVGFALTWPVIHARYHHAALMMQSVIIAALALYFLGRNKTWSSHRVSAAFIGLTLIALTIHPYFLPFTAGLFVAFLADQALKGESWVLQLKRLLAFGLVFGLAAWGLGYLGRQSSYLGGYGSFFYLDLRMPFCGDGKLIDCGVGPVFDFPYDEGFNYLGAGLLFLVPFAVLFNWRSVLAFPKQYPALLLLLVGFFLYALSNRVRFAGVEVFSFALPSWLHWLTGTFRASGRFFWLVSQLILFVTLASLLRKRTSSSWSSSSFWSVNHVSMLLLTVALILQVKDVKPWLDRIKTEAAKPSQVNYADWAPVMTQVDKVVIYPTYQCASPHYQHYIWVMQLAGYYGKLINSGYTARSHLTCAADEVAINKPLAARHLYMISSSYYHSSPFSSNFTYPIPIVQAMARGECIRRPDGLACLPGSTPDFWKNLPLVSSPIQLIPEGRQWRAVEFNTNIGKVVGAGFEQRLQPKDPEKEGWLSFGPSVALPAGTYRYVLEYVSDAASSQHIGNWDVVLANQKQQASGQLVGTQGQLRRLEGMVTVAPQNADEPFEIRTYYLAKGDLQMVSSALQKVQ
jgi:hypothetical protein